VGAGGGAKAGDSDDGGAGDGGGNFPHFLILSGDL